MTITQEKVNNRLLDAAMKGDNEKVLAALDAGAAIDALDYSGYTALMLAAGNGHTETCQLLLDKEADINVANKNGYTALMSAAYKNSPEICKMLLERGADVHALNDDGRTVLIQIARYGHTEICQLLLDNGADINAVARDGYTALMLAAGSGQTETCRLLLDKEADINAVNKNGSTALMLASYNHRIEACHLLMRYGAIVPTISPKEEENFKKYFFFDLSEMKASAQEAFPAGQKPARETCLTPEGKPTDALLDACASGLFVQRIAAPLLHTKNPDNRKLFFDIYKSLPKHWKNEEATLYLQAVRGMQQTKTPSPPGRGLG
jgi:ankyrin repeat protein